MDLNEFVANFAELFDDTNPSEIKADTNFRDLDEWSSLVGMGIIALAKTTYNVGITGAELRNCNTIEDVFNLIKNK